ncbi:MAG TPA: alginate export family protein [Fimbriimonas sp.]|nr:alginate export family protein [Fimbriimonas sp.]
MFIFTLPQIKWLPIYELRSRVERRIDPDFSSAIGDNQTRWDNRLRAGTDFSSGKNVTGQLRYQYSHSTFWRPTLNNSDDNSDLLLGNISYKQGKSTWTVGRQMITKGDRRLIDVSDYSQRPKVFDAVRFRLGRFDGFAGKVGMTSDITDYSKISMASYQTSLGETMAVYKLNDKIGTNVWTLDQRYAKTQGKLKYQIEGALQQGKSTGKGHKAWFSNARVEYAQSKNTTLYTEANVASGGVTNNEQHLFDPLYGTGHTPYGLMDVQGLRNMRHLEIGVQQKLTTDLSSKLSFNGYGLYDPADGWYSNGGGINRRPGGRIVDPTGQSGRDVGNEINLAFAWTPNKRDTVNFELGVFTPGNFVKKVVGPAATRQVWGLLSYQAKF